MHLRQRVNSLQEDETLRFDNKQPQGTNTCLTNVKMWEQGKEKIIKGFKAFAKTQSFNLNLKNT